MYWYLMYMVETPWLERGENIAHGGMPGGWRLSYTIVIHNRDDQTKHLVINWTKFSVHEEKKM
jgi:hypothetical protein